VGGRRGQQRFVADMDKPKNEQTNEQLSKFTTDQFTYCIKYNRKKEKVDHKVTTHQNSDGRITCFLIL